MSLSMSYQFLKIGLSAVLGVTMVAGVARAQQEPKTPSQVDIYCSGFATDQAVPRDTYLISGEDSSYRTTYFQGDKVFINHGADQGVKVGDEFEVLRPIHELLEVNWFKGQDKVIRAMGPVYSDIGHLRVVNVQGKTSTSEVTMACDNLQRGDIVRPFVARPAPPFHTGAFDSFAPPSGKKMGMLVTSKGYGQVSGMGRIVYINLGSAQGVQVGDYFRVFRYQGTRNEVPFQPRDTAYKIYGYGSAPVEYKSSDLPRQILGEGIVLRTGPNASTVMLTISKQEIYAGDYAEIE
jgi:hypothetical protein